MGIDRWDISFAAVLLTHIILCPYTKVEESFNMQGVHDMMVYNYDVENYDHHEFPGVVKRTFMAALGLAYLTFPLFYSLVSLGFAKLCGLIITRLNLATINFLAYRYLRTSVSKVFGEDAGIALYIITCCQFHLPFYMSRTLPNTYALTICVLIFAFWIQERYKEVGCLLAFGGICFRCDLILLALPIGIWMILYANKAALKQTVFYSVIMAVVSLIITISVDSFFWRTFTWPEFEVLFFNTYENKSHEWGVSPWYWYFTSAIPKMLMGEIMLFAAGIIYQQPKAKIIDPRMTHILFPVLSFVVLYSFLPHKELRFLFPIAPGINIITAIGFIKITKCIYKSDFVNASLLILASLALIATCLGTALALYVSHYNYPGAIAIQDFTKAYTKMKEMDQSMPNPYIHIDVYPAQTGITRFNEYVNNWRYSKKENLTDDDLQEFTHLITDKPNVKGFTILRAIKGFEKIDWRNRKIELADKIYIYKRDDIHFHTKPLVDHKCRETHA
ncbi:ALG12 [Blepharisma stoltei]|uniref:Mannosyltransferase n=1 Tax=Blepharisma stoltei TaxID=1481888 RepID=A0AAU9KAX2_9CILI|nr:unnamed protein product [Blepharisma stoltei]